METLQGLQGYAAATIDAFFVAHKATRGDRLSHELLGELLAQMQRVVERMGPDAAQGPWLYAFIHMTRVHADHNPDV